MPNHFKSCSCSGCREALRTNVGGYRMKKAVRRMRHNVKAALRKGKDMSNIGSEIYDDHCTNTYR